MLFFFYSDIKGAFSYLYHVTLNLVLHLSSVTKR